MHNLSVKMIATALIVCVCALQCKLVICETWGNIYTTSLIDTEDVQKFAIPLFVREAIVKFPAVSGILLVRLQWRIKQY